MVPDHLCNEADSAGSGPGSAFFQAVRERLCVAGLGIQSFARLSLQNAAANFHITMPCLAYIMTGWLVISINRPDLRFGVFEALAYSGVIFNLMLLGVLPGAILLQPRRPIAAIKSLVNDLSNVDNLARGMWLILLFGPFAAVFTRLKSLIGDLGPEAMDPWLRQADCAIHFVCPDIWLVPTFVSPWIYMLVSLAYNAAWFVVISGTICYVALLAPENTYRSRMLWCYFMAWIVLGTLMATLLHSGGPAFYDLVTANSDYSEMMRALTSLADQVPVSSMSLIEVMRTEMTEGGIGAPGLAISAMPSLHVAMSTLVACYAWHLGGPARWLSVAYMFFVLYASMALGWHYAVDGYVSIIASIGLWRLSDYIYSP